MGFATTLTALSLVGAAVGALGSYQQAQAQKSQARFQAQAAERQAVIARQNADLALEEGREAKKIGYENSLRQRQEAARIIGTQRAAQAASGVQTDVGSALDVNLTTAEHGELDALALYDQGQRQDYIKRVEAWNLREQAVGNAAAGAMYARQGQAVKPWLAGGTTLLAGVTQAGSNYAFMTK